MQKRTHLLFAVLLFLMLNNILEFPIYLSIFVIVGALIPDIDLFPRKYHRKICHNIWFLLICLMMGYQFLEFNQTILIVFSIGFISHLISDSITPMGIMFLWPIKKPKIKGPIRTGSILEYIIALFILLGIFSIMGFVKISFALI